MKQIGAIAILSTMLLGFLAWGGSQIIDNKTDIAGLKENIKSSLIMQSEIRTDIKKLLERSNK